MAKKKKPSTSTTAGTSKVDLKSPLSPTGKDRPPIPSIFIPPTPSPSTQGPSSEEKPNLSHAAYTTPPASPPSQRAPLPSVSDVINSPKSPAEELNLNATAIVSPDLLALANFQASIKQALANLSTTIGELEEQSSRMQELGVDIKVHEQIDLLRVEVEKQIARQKADLETVEQTLAVKVKAALTELIKERMRESVRETISKLVQDKVHGELMAQIPGELREKLIAHHRQIEEVKSSIHNSEARRYNASLQSASLEVPLRPLLRPLPTPEQSPYPNLATSVPAPAPTPIRRSTSAFSGMCGPISRSQSYQHNNHSVAPTPSALFPKDLKSLFALGPDATKILLKEYGLESTTPSPTAEEANLGAPKMQRRASSNKSKAATAASQQPSIPEESDVEEEDVQLEAHVQDMNKFMSHIGVPFLMVPPPKRKETNAEKRRKLAPLIINTAPFVR
ncbi:hypothetical protein CC1G_01963 [Coprinopsis cinerea okayama7|uniref:Uncharacterized protein n=1 Tax=Coprinopsis cinerea (strain Okayama-7 / 130 / ATCC MYA-4618 / FGSC 9003) TaxID=240176 RepID=A8N644_COPC7|nr:hypothetical protein CC1G_01963 [Coprinopsis cinerea okayama7\|eukprot:XP_001830327.2 hypothetical protein CC1G_01963 [Coprinopsis cinerea okayama7\